MSLRDDINEATKCLPNLNFEFVDSHRFQGILEQFAELFLQHGKRDLGSVWLWEKLREQTLSSQPPDSLCEIASHLDPDEHYWFIASEENGKYWVADATGDSILVVIREMYCFEYYIVDRKMTWMLCENHHGMLIGAKSRNSTTT